MTFGENTDSRRWRLPALLLACSFLPGAAPLSVAETSSQVQTERAAGSDGWTVERLIGSLSKSLQSEVRYEETSFSTLLTKPLKTQGILRVTPPATLEKHVTAPHAERYVVEGETVFFTSKAKGVDRALPLQDYPGLRAFVEAFRSFLSNDVATLRRLYGVTLEGEPRRWILTLRPLDKATQELVEAIRFSGEGEQLKGIEVLAPDGDRSVMVITAGAP
jgi:hypothetical protein